MRYWIGDDETIVPCCAIMNVWMLLSKQTS